MLQGLTRITPVLCETTVRSMYKASSVYPTCYNFPMLKQRTIRQLVKTIGVGLHSGTKVELTLRPAEIDTGILFRRVDFDPPVLLPASIRVTGTGQCSTTCCSRPGCRSNRLRRNSCA